MCILNIIQNIIVPILNNISKNALKEAFQRNNNYITN